MLSQDYPDLALTKALGDALVRKTEVPVLTDALLAECAAAVISPPGRSSAPDRDARLSSQTLA